jgi:hypothetical protein
VFIISPTKRKRREKMEAVAAVILGVVLFMQAWQLFGLSHPKTTGLVGAAGAIVLVSLLAWQPLPLLSGVKAQALSVSIGTWAIYAALVAAVGLWNFEPRGFGLYSIWAVILAIGQIIYCSATMYSLTGMICGIINVVAFAMVFCYYGLVLSKLRVGTAWVLVIVGVIHGILAASLLMA